MPYFFCRLNAPRPTFPFDMTEAERDLMGRHGAYTRALADKGIAIVFGPVLDPKGPWGLAVFEAQDEPSLRALIDADPVIQADLGFNYEILPMMQAVLGSKIQSPAP